MSKFFKGNVISFATDIEQYLSFNFSEEAFRNKYWNVQKHDIVIDIGVDFGPYTLTALAQGAEHVYAIEPRMEAIEKLVENIRLNPDMLDRISIIRAAVSDKSYELITLQDSNVSTRDVNTVSKRFTSNISKQEEVITITIDDLVEKYNIKQLDWLKIDVEGMENKVILGAENTLIHLRPKILLENHSKSNEENNNKLLKGIGYELIHRNKEFFHNMFTYNSQSVYHHFWE